MKTHGESRAFLYGLTGLAMLPFVLCLSQGCRTAGDQGNDNQQAGCTTNADCAEGEVCQTGQCVAQQPECTTNGDCAEGEVCQDGQCVAGQAPDGAALFAANCSLCHGADGAGGDTAPDIRGSTAADITAKLGNGTHPVEIALTAEEAAAIAQFLAG